MVLQLESVKTAEVDAFMPESSLLVPAGWKWRGSEPIPSSRSHIGVDYQSSRKGTFGGHELGVFNILQHVSSAPVASPVLGLQGEGGLLWISLPVTSGWLQGVPGGTLRPNRSTEQKVGVWVVLEGFCASADSRRPHVFAFTSGCCRGPEWTERTASKSKPVTAPFCCIPSPLSPPPHPAASSCTDDVTDCCEHCFHGNTHHRFGLHFRQLSLPPFLSHHPPSICAPCHPPFPVAWQKGGTGT